jgi:hypothetical protein
VCCGMSYVCETDDTRGAQSAAPREGRVLVRVLVMLVSTPSSATLVRLDDFGRSSFLSLFVSLIAPLF